MTACNSSTISVYLVNAKDNCPLALEVEFVGQTSTPLQTRVMDLSLVPTFQDREYTIHVTDENGQTAVVVVNFAYAKTNQRPRMFKLVHCFGTWHDDQFKDTAGSGADGKREIQVKRSCSCHTHAGSGWGGGGGEGGGGDPGAEASPGS